MRDAPDSVMIFAAGFGTRMKHLTRDRPKPLIPVAGKALIDYALDRIEDAGVKHCVANVHYKAAMMSDHLNERGVAISDESDEILETGGGLRKALPLLPKGPVFTMNSDVIFQGPNPLSALRNAWDAKAMDALLLLIPPAAAHGTANAGDFEMAPDGRLSRGPGAIYSGVQIINPTSLAAVPDAAFSLNTVWNAMQREGRLFGVTYSGAWCDVGHPEGIAIAENLLKASHV